ncbi:hypothetical protein C8Q80DRAFT_1110511 [Daedaleopsis nitida]|nr:hypothetical protein C8Q80DRAFT_1110511 [Daedaleopsis nitida]
MASPTDSQTSNLQSSQGTSSKSPPHNISFAPLPDHPRPVASAADGEQLSSVAFVKGGKRKRLSKACDACHKSKRRCDGTSPCSNCYYASKNCTYTDAAGRPVPAPRSLHSERTAGFPAATAHPANEPPPWAGHATLANPPVGPPSSIERDPTTKRSRRGSGAPDTSPPLVSKLDSLTEAGRQLLDPADAHELVNIFFAHCNPQRMVIHKPSFIADFGLNKVPNHLLLAVCAVAAPLSKSIASHASHARLAGVPYFQEALSLMFDQPGRLLCDPTVSTAQTLCLLEMHEIAASHSWTRQFRYFELALQVLEGSLEVQRADNAAPPSPSHTDGVMHFIDRECTRRCFWLIQLMAWISNIYTHRGVPPRMAELADVVRLPIDETTFDLASLSSSATSEYLRRPAPRTRYASQSGHMLRILEIYHNVESSLAKEESVRLKAMEGFSKELEDWIASLPAHLQFNEENLETQVTMFETSANSGAWCFCFMHAMYPCCFLAVLEGKGKYSAPIPWVRDQLNLIFAAAGTRAKTSILSACALWSYSKYSADDPQIHVWDREFDKLWGFKVIEVAIQWRQSQQKEKERAQQQQQQQQQHHHHHQQPQHQPQQQQSLQQQQQQLYQPREPAKSESSSPPSAHSSPGAQALTHAHAQPYEGRQGNPRALLRTNVSMSDLESVAHSQGVPLPSLKASGLLDSWKPPSGHETFANSLNSLSLGHGGGGGGGLGLGLGLGQSHSGSANGTSNGTGMNGGVHRVPQMQAQGLVATTLPSSHTWIVDADGGRI